MKKIAIANWKMRLTLKNSSKLAGEFKEKFKNLQADGDVVVCPSFLSINETKKILKKTKIKMGAQDAFWEESGSYTGEVSPNMIREAGCEYIIIGHSERRRYLLENYEMIHQKVKAVLKAEKLTPIVCIGENSDDRKTDKRDFVLIDQLQQALGGISLLRDQQIVVAYEPVWAIGSGLVIEPEEAEYAHKIIGITLNDIFGPEVASKNIRVVYGGSITSKNVKDFVGLENIDGVLVGGASLDANEFYKIAKTIIT